MQYFKDEKLNCLALELRGFAEKQAKLENTTFWKILRNKVIVSICKKQPMSIEDFSIKKVLIGKQKIENYGKEIVKIVRKYYGDEDEIIDGVSPETKDERIIVIKQGGFYYNVSGNDALILHKYLGYKLYGVKTPRTGFPVSYESTVLKKIDTLQMNYDLLDQKGALVVSKRFENNLYKFIDMKYPSDTDVSNAKKADDLYKTKRTFKEKMTLYIEILQGLGEGINIMTGEAMEGLDEELKLQLFEMSLYFDDRLKAKEKLEANYPQHGQKWTQEEDDQLLKEYQEDKSIKEISEIHGRGIGAIRSRLIKLGAQI